MCFERGFQYNRKAVIAIVGNTGYLKRFQKIKAEKAFLMFLLRISAGVDS